MLQQLFQEALAAELEQMKADILATQQQEAEAAAEQQRQEQQQQGEREGRGRMGVPRVSVVIGSFVLRYRAGSLLRCAVNGQGWGSVGGVGGWACPG